MFLTVPYKATQPNFNSCLFFAGQMKSVPTGFECAVQRGAQ